MASLDESKWQQLSNIAHQRKLAMVFSSSSLRDNRPILIKGWSVGRFYSEGHFRVCNDVDLIFPESDQDMLSTTLGDLSSVAAIDAHFGPRHLDKLSFEELFAGSYEVELDNIPIRVLSDEDNLRVTAVHWLTDGGVNKERLWDIYYLVKNRRPDFDWDRCLNSSGIVRRSWVIAAIATASDHLGLDVSELPIAVREFQLPSWFQRTLQKEWERGIYTRRILSTVLTKPKYLLEQLNRKLPPNPIAATIETERPIDDTSRMPAQVGSFMKKVGPFARGVGRRIADSLGGSRR